MARDGTKNLIPTTARSENEVKEMQSRGGVNSGKARREKKEKQDLLKMVLEIPVNDRAQRDKLAKYGIPDNQMTNAMLTEIALVEQAKKGDIQAKKYIDERTGINPLLELRREELDLKREQASDTDTTTLEIVTATLTAVKQQADALTKEDK